MDILNGIQNFLLFINDSWTTIMVIIGLCMALVKKISSFLKKSDEEKVSIAKAQVHEMILKMITDAEASYADWNNAGAIKRSQVISEIYCNYPILSKIINQDELTEWINVEIDNALVTLREITETNKVSE